MSTDPLDRPPVADHGADRHGYVEVQHAPDGGAPDEAMVDRMLATACADCRPNLFLRWVHPTEPITDPPSDWVDVNGNRWHLTVAHDEGCPAYASIVADGGPLPCPECRTGKHPNCDGTTWDDATDAPAPCPCAERGHA